MSLVAVAFAVDINKVKAVFGSKDKDLLEKIQTTELNERYSVPGEEFPDTNYQYDFSKALEDIIFHYVRPEDRKANRHFLGLVKSKPGSGLDKSIAHAYGYVLLVICDYLGTYLLPQCEGFYHGRIFEAAVAIMKENGLQLNLHEMFEQHEVFDIPNNNDFPAIKLFNKQEVEHVNEVMNRIEIDENKTDFESEDFDEVQEMLKHIRDSFRMCKERNAELITFTH